MRLRFTTLFLLALTVLTVGAFAMTDDMVKLPDADKYHLQALEAQYQFETLWMQNAVNTIIEQNPQLKQHRDLANQKGQEFAALQDQLWMNAAKIEVTKDSYRLDVTAGAFVKTKPAQ